jgi:mobilome CxxCx(11)CxxC protein
MDEKYDKLRIECWEKSYHSFGKEYLFDKRSQLFSKRINLLKVFGIVIPAGIGSVVLGYELPNDIYTLIKGIAAFLLIIQFIFSIFAIVFKWDDELAYSYEAAQDYVYLYDVFNKLAKFPPPEFSELEKKFDIINTQYKRREQQDNKHDIKESELRKGMRYSLREHKIACYGCKEIPLSMKSTDCDICGKF